MLPVCAPAHPDQANQISGHHTITKEWSDVWGNHRALRQDNLTYYFLEPTKIWKRGGQGRKGSGFQKLGAATGEPLRCAETQSINQDRWDENTADGEGFASGQSYQSLSNPLWKHKEFTNESPGQLPWGETCLRCRASRHKCIYAKVNRKQYLIFWLFPLFSVSSMKCDQT